MHRLEAGQPGSLPPDAQPDVRQSRAGLLGVAGVLALLWPMLLLPVPVALVHRMLIPFEEARMRDASGKDFESYCARIRRWL